MKKGFALPLVIGLILLITLLSLSYWHFITKSNSSNQQTSNSGTAASGELKVMGRVADVAGGPTWVGDQLDFRDTKISIETQDKKLLTVIIPNAKDATRRCPNDNAPAVYDEIEVFGNLEGGQLICKSPNHYIKYIVPTKPITLKSFTDSRGKEKFVVLDFNKEALGNYYNNIYVSLKKDNVAGATKVVNVQGSSLDKSPFISTNTGVKYLVIAQYGPGDGQQFTLVDENGKNIGIGLGTMGLGTKIPGMLGLQFGNWIGNTTNFIIKVISGNGHSYEGTFDATTGKQVGQTKQTG